MISCYISAFPDDADIVFNRLKRAIHMARYPGSAPPTLIFEKLTEDYEEDICTLTGLLLSQEAKIKASSCAMQVVHVLSRCTVPDVSITFRDADQGLHPRIARELVKRMSLACRNNRTHVHFSVNNPSSLDGLDWEHDQLFAIERNSLEVVRTRRIQLKQFTNCPDPLSSLWLAGNLGAVP